MILVYGFAVFGFVCFLALVALVFRIILTDEVEQS